MRERMIRVVLYDLSQKGHGLFHPIIFREKVCKKNARFELLRIERERVVVGCLRFSFKLTATEILRGCDAIGFAEISPRERVIWIKCDRLFQQLYSALMIIR